MLPSTPKTKRKLSLESEGQETKKLDNKATPDKNMASTSSTSSSSILGAPSLLVGGNGGDSVTNEDMNKIDISVDNFNPDAPEAEGVDKSSYSSKVKKVKRAFPYAAFILGEGDKRSRISKKHFNAFVAHYNRVVGNFSVEEEDLINIEFTHHEDGIGVVACGDSHTLQFIKKEALSFIYEKKTIRAWARWERGSAMVYHGFLHGENFKTEKPNFVIGQAMKKRKYPGTFDNCVFDTKVTDGVYVSFEPDATLAAELDKTMVLRVRAHRIKLNKRMRKQHTEEEFIQFFSKKNADAAKKEAEAKKRSPEEMESSD